MSTKFYSYQFGPEPIAAMGKMPAFGNRVLCRAILENDHYSGPLQLVVYNAIDAVAFEIVSVGGGVAKACDAMGEKTPRVGQHCDVRSVAADRVNSKDLTGRYWLVPVEDIAAVWDPVAADAPGLADAIEEVRARQQGGGGRSVMAAPSNGEAELSPG